MPKELGPIKNAKEFRGVVEFASDICAQLNNEEAKKFFNSGALNFIKSQPGSLAVRIQFKKQVKGFFLGHLTKGPSRDFAYCYVGTNPDTKDKKVTRRMLKKIVPWFKKFNPQTILHLEGVTKKDVKMVSGVLRRNGIIFNAASIT